MFAFASGPGGDGRHEGRSEAVHQAERAIVGTDSADFALVVTTLGTEAHELQKAREVRRSDFAVGKAGNFANAVREFNASARSEDRAAVGGEQLNEGRDGKHADESGNHQEAAL